MLILYCGINMLYFKNAYAGIYFIGVLSTGSVTPNNGSALVAPPAQSAKLGRV